ncbi:MAG: hypothetical protein JWL72_4532 [Ilumatobacteraceae bacterium]|nr:hypothetical protein [Ilumatobacteraceae bacterium]MCU1391194.1 hypothetical protein [Ilumatobacteraceae bacterium]
MGAASPFDLLLITIAIGAGYGVLAWRFLVVPAQRRRGAVPQQPTLLRVAAAPRLRLVVDNTASR